MIRPAFRQAAEFFLQVVDQIPAASWDSPGLGEWSLRDLVGHTGRALTTLESYSANPASQVTLHWPVDYLTQALDSLANPSQVAQRGKEAGQALGNDPKEAIGETAHRVLTLVDQLPDSLIIGLPIGGISLIDYLPSRVMELTIHTLDLAAALELRIQPPRPRPDVHPTPAGGPGN